MFLTAGGAVVVVVLVVVVSDEEDELDDDVFTSTPGNRLIGAPPSRSVSVNDSTGAGAGTTTTTFAVSKPSQASPLNVGVDVTAFGGVRGLPHLQRTRGTPRLSTSTAVPRSSTSWIGFALLFLKPWLVTRVSPWSTTSVSVATYDEI